MVSEGLRNFLKLIARSLKASNIPWNRKGVKGKDPIIMIRMKNQIGSEWLFTTDVYLWKLW